MSNHTYPTTLREEELKNKVAQDYFGAFDCTQIRGNIDFCVAQPRQEVSLLETPSLLWAEAKRGTLDTLDHPIAQLVLTIGKARTFDRSLPPAYLGAFDSQKVAFIPYNDIHEFFYQNDFNWRVRPSDTHTREFGMILQRVSKALQENAYRFRFGEKELQAFIKANFVAGKDGITKIRIDKNNFVPIYRQWLEKVKPEIAIGWEAVKKSGLIDGDFYLADLLSKENNTLKEKLFVLLQNDKYILDRKIDANTFLKIESSVGFLDKQRAHREFWNRYERPPREEYWDYIVDRRDLLVPQDIRERKGSYYTPKKWVDKSQEYLAKTLGEDWQDDYYIWDCAAGTGNLLQGLQDKYRIWASTLDKQDVDVMKDRIQHGANLLESHVFQFDFLNDDFTSDKLPSSLRDIINDPAKRKRLIIYINPPYAEVAINPIGRTGATSKRGVSFTKVRERYSDKIGIATKELFAQFLIRVSEELKGVILAQFSKLKIVQGANFSRFRGQFLAQYRGGFIAPANTFDNVKGKFPIGFMIWDTNTPEKMDRITCDIFDRSATLLGKKNFYAYEAGVYLTDWYRQYHTRENDNQNIGAIGIQGSDFQNQKTVRITDCTNYPIRYTFITPANLLPTCIYFAVRHCIKASWINDRDQFLAPNDGWQQDTEFQNDCLAFTLFHGQNRITHTQGVNHWIPFTEAEVGAREAFQSHWMTDFLAGRVEIPQSKEFFSEVVKAKRLSLSPAAGDVFMAGKALWKYYHAQDHRNVNASLYDIRQYFQGVNAKGSMNAKSDDARYETLRQDLNQALDRLAQTKLWDKVFAYRFLKR